MISKDKLYRFNKKKLQYVEIEANKDSKFIRFVRFFSISTVLSLTFLFIFFLIMGSPVELFLAKELNNYKNKYYNINADISDIQNTLKSRYYKSDNRYREILNLDTIPLTMRDAGFGGADPYTNNSPDNLYSELISSTLKKIDALKNQTRIQENSFKTIHKEAIKRDKALLGIPAISPVNPGEKTRITSYFGARTDPFTHRTRRHEGLDIAGTPNTKIFSSANGFVTLVKESRTGYGKEVVITHSFGYSTRYAHLNKILVSEGDTIKRGQLIGLMGSTGRSTGTHLHYEVRLNNRPVNPMYYFSDNISKEEYELILNQTQEAEN